MSEGESLPERFFNLLEIAIDENGFYPHQYMAKQAHGGLHCYSIAVPQPVMVYQQLWIDVFGTETDEIIFGLDRTTQDGQGTEFNDALVCVYWKRECPTKFAVGVVNYQFEPRVIRPFDWNNSFWISRVQIELNSTRAVFARARIMSKSLPTILRDLADVVQLYRVTVAQIISVNVNWTGKACVVLDVESFARVFNLACRPKLNQKQHDDETLFVSFSAKGIRWECLLRKNRSDHRTLIEQCLERLQGPNQLRISGRQIAIEEKRGASSCT